MSNANIAATSAVQSVPEFEPAETLYPAFIPYSDLLPQTSRFEVFSGDSSLGRGIRTKVAFERGAVMARFSGFMTREILQHTLQVTPVNHIHDPFFIGLLSHSCAPNSMLDMVHLDILALTDIEAGSILTVDYAHTEDHLYRQFPCDCGSPNCRHWITGRRERINAEGLAHLAQRNAG